MPRFAIIDPLTLVGQEINAEIRRSFPEADLSLFHTLEDQEHQIASVGGQAALVPPVSESNAFSGVDVVVLASDQTSSRLKVLEKALEDNPDLVFIDASPLNHYRHLTSPALDADVMTQGARLRPAHPAIVVAVAITEALAAFQLTAMSIAAVEPVSIFGKDAIGILAQQASQRLQGENVKKAIDDYVAAFNMTARSGADLTEEASELLPQVEVAVTRTLGGCFHGHLTMLGLVFASDLGESSVIEALKRAPGISVKNYPLRLDGVGDMDKIWVTRPEISKGGRTLCLQAMVDGTRIGGALTVASILQGLQ